ncbi:MAG: C-terminal binding protein [Planctomycetota bacterium]
MPKPLVVITDHGYPSDKPERDALAASGAKIVVRACKMPGEVLEACQDADGVIVRMAPCDRAAIEAMKRCRVISRYGIGVDNVDVRAATERGIWVANVPDYCYDEVSEQALALIMACARRVVESDRLARAGKGPEAENLPVRRIRGSVLGLLALGGIARTLVKKASGLGFARVLATDPVVKPEQAKSLGVELVNIDTLLKESDYLSIHAPLLPSTRHIINRENLAKMKKGAVIVNTSRGPIVDGAALLEALKSGHIAAAGLDVFEHEPIRADDPLLSMPNVVATAHLGWYSLEARDELQRRAAEAVAKVLSGGKPDFVVNPDVKPRKV